MDKKKIIFVDEEYESLDGGSQFAEEAPQFSDTSNVPEVDDMSNTSLSPEPIVNEPSVNEPSVNVSVEQTGGEDVSSELSDGPDLSSLQVGDNASVASDVMSEYSDDGLLSEGGASSISDVSSVRTTELLSVDPLYIRLTKFLETDVKLEGGSSKKVNVVDVLHDISVSLKSITASLNDISTYSKKSALEKLKQ
jgi:hypothetical protein